MVYVIACPPAEYEGSESCSACSVAHPMIISQSLVGQKISSLQGIHDFANETFINLGGQGKVCFLEQELGNVILNKGCCFWSSMTIKDLKELPQVMQFIACRLTLQLKVLNFEKLTYFSVSRNDFS